MELGVELLLSRAKSRANQVCAARSEKRQKAGMEVKD